MRSKFYIIFLALIYIGCLKTEEKFIPSLKEEKVINYTNSWSSFISKRLYDVMDFFAPIGPVKEMKVWVVNPEDNNEETVIFYKTYSRIGLIRKEIQYSHGEEGGYYFEYDEQNRLISYQDSKQGDLISNRCWSYKYLEFEEQMNIARRELYKEGELLQTEKLLISENSHELIIKYSDNNISSERIILIFDGNNLTKYINEGLIKIETNYLYDEENRVVSQRDINYQGDLIFERHYKYNSLKNIQECITYDYRSEEPVIYSIQKTLNHDEYKNWIRKEIYVNDELVSIVERQIVYW